MTARIHEAIEMLKRFAGTVYEPAARAYLEAQIEIARRGPR